MRCRAGGQCRPASDGEATAAAVGSASELAQALRKALNARKDEPVIQPEAPGSLHLALFGKALSRVNYAVAGGLLTLVAAAGAVTAYWRQAHTGP